MFSVVSKIWPGPLQMCRSMLLLQPRAGAGLRPATDVAHVPEQASGLQPCAGAGPRPAATHVFLPKKWCARVPACRGGQPATGKGQAFKKGPNSALWGVTVHGSHANGLFWPRRRPPLMGAGGENFQKNAANFQHFLESVPVCLLNLAYACRPVGKCIQIGPGQTDSA